MRRSETRVPQRHGKVWPFLGYFFSFRIEMKNIIIYYQFQLVCFKLQVCLEIVMTWWWQSVYSWWTSNIVLVKMVIGRETWQVVSKGNRAWPKFAFLSRRRGCRFSQCWCRSRLKKRKQEQGSGHEEGSEEKSSGRGNVATHTEFALYQAQFSCTPTSITVMIIHISTGKNTEDSATSRPQWATMHILAHAALQLSP